MRPKLILLIGPPCSGKSTWSSNYVKNRKAIRLNRDDFRLSMFSRFALTQQEEDMICEGMTRYTLNALKLGYDVVIDQTNNEFKYISKYFCMSLGLADLKVKVFTSDLKTLLKRNQIRAIEKREAPIPDEFMKQMYDKHQSLVNKSVIKGLLKTNGYLD